MNHVNGCCCYDNDDYDDDGMGLLIVMMVTMILMMMMMMMCLHIDLDLGFERYIEVAALLTHRNSSDFNVDRSVR